MALDKNNLEPIGTFGVPKDEHEAEAAGQTLDCSNGLQVSAWIEYF